MTTESDKPYIEPKALATEADAEQHEEQTRLASVAQSIADVAGPVLSAARSPFDNIASGARRIIGDRGGARVRRVRRMGHQPLANLWELHPEAHRASIRELGLQGVQVEQVAGTAVEGAAQRGGDFLPLRDRRSADWRGRWQRILRAIDTLVTLPPVELIKFGDEYWVVDGHNRVAGALYTGQGEIDSIVQELRLPGMRSEPRVLIAGVLQGSMDLRDAGAGRYNRTLTRPIDRLPMQLDMGDDPDDRESHQHGPYDDAAEE
ncbi:MAG: hypothetical protein ABIP53_12030 [Candidatus Limnocylindrales bacterium]